MDVHLPDVKEDIGIIFYAKEGDPVTVSDGRLTAH